MNLKNFLSSIDDFCNDTQKDTLHLCLREMARMVPPDEREAFLNRLSAIAQMLASSDKVLSLTAPDKGMMGALNREDSNANPEATSPHSLKRTHDSSHEAKSCAKIESACEKAVPCEKVDSCEDPQGKTASTCPKTRQAQENDTCANHPGAEPEPNEGLPKRLKTTIKSEDQKAEEYLSSEVDRVLDFFLELDLNSPQVYLNTEFKEGVDYYHHNDDEDAPDYEFLFSDDFGFIVNLKNSFVLIHQCVDYELFEDGLSLARKLMNLTVNVEGDLNENFSVDSLTFEEFSAYGLITKKELKGFTSDLMPLLYFNYDAKTRVKMAVKVIESSHGYRHIDFKVLKGIRHVDIKEYDEFLVGLLKVLIKAKSCRVVDYISDVIDCIYNLSLVKEEAFSYLKTYPMLMKRYVLFMLADCYEHASKASFSDAANVNAEHALNLTYDKDNYKKTDKALDTDNDLNDKHGLSAKKSMRHDEDLSAVRSMGYEKAFSTAKNCRDEKTCSDKEPSSAENHGLAERSDSVLKSSGDAENSSSAETNTRTYKTCGGSSLQIMKNGSAALNTASCEETLCKILVLIEEAVERIPLKFIEREELLEIGGLLAHTLKKTCDLEKLCHELFSIAITPDNYLKLRYYAKDYHKYDKVILNIYENAYFLSQDKNDRRSHNQLKRSGFTLDGYHLMRMLDGRAFEFFYCVKNNLPLNNYHYSLFYKGLLLGMLLLVKKEWHKETFHFAIEELSPVFSLKPELLDASDLKILSKTGLMQTLPSERDLIGYWVEHTKVLEDYEPKLLSLVEENLNALIEDALASQKPGYYPDIVNWVGALLEIFRLYEQKGKSEKLVNMLLEKHQGKKMLLKMLNERGIKIGTMG